MSHEEPASTTLLDGVNAVAPGMLRQHDEQRLCIMLEYLSEHAVFIDFVSKGFSTHSLCLAGNLPEGDARSRFHTQEYRDAYHLKRAFHPFSSQPSAFDVVAIGASLGGFDALRNILAALPSDFPTPIVVTQHLSEKSLLPTLLSRGTPLHVQWANAEEHLRPGTVYIAIPDYHLTVNSSKRLTLSSSDKVNFARPSVDVLLDSVAESFGTRAIGVVLTGMRCDGAKGAKALKAKGGRVIVQDPATARESGMPTATIHARAANYVLPLAAIAPALITLTMVQGATRVFSGAMPVVA